MNECRDILGSISSYLDGDLPPSSCEDIEQHCRECEGCDRLVAGLRESIGLCRQAGAQPLPPAVLERARASVRRLLDGS